MNKNITSPSGLKLLTAGKYCAEDIQITPVLQEKTTTENGEVTADSGYTGLSKVTVNVASGAELNIAYGDTAPEDTSKLWVEGAEPSKVIATNQMNGSETLNTVNAYLTKGVQDSCCARVGTDIYIFAYDTIVKFNTLTKTVTTLSATLPVQLRYASCASVGTDIYIFGGYVEAISATVNTIYKFDTTTETVTTLSATLPSARHQTSCASVGTDIYIFGGSSAWYTSSATYYGAILKFDTTTETITTLAISTRSMTLTSSASVGTDIYIFGGQYKASSSSSSATYLKTIIKFNTLTGSLQTLSVELPSLRSAHNGAVSVVGSNVYIFGGFYNNSNYNTILKFDTLTETIITLSATLEKTGYTMCSASVGTDIYIFGVSSSTAIYEFAVAVDLPQNQLLLNTTLNKNVFKIINAESAEIEIGVNAVYRGNSEGVAEQETARLYDTTQEAWVDVVTGEAEGGESTSYTVTVNSESWAQSTNIYDGQNSSGELLGTISFGETIEVTCSTGYLHFSANDANKEGITINSGSITFYEEANGEWPRTATLKVESDGSVTVAFSQD